jgi:RecB family endonuclease NucS
MTTCAQAIKEVFKSKEQILTSKQIIDAVQKKYPNQWKEVTIRTHTMGCSVNHSSSKWYPSFPKFLYTVGPGKVRLYDREKDGEFETGIKSGAEDDVLTEEDALEVTLSLERDLQEYLSRDLSQLEPGLQLYTEHELTGREVSTEAGKIDILAKDKKDALVVIELKASQASYSALGQILSYVASIKSELGAKSVRGIIVADDFDKKLTLAVTEVPDVSLIRYKVRFDFEKAG